MNLILMREKEFVGIAEINNNFHSNFESRFGSLEQGQYSIAHRICYQAPMALCELHSADKGVVHET